MLLCAGTLIHLGLVIIQASARIPRWDFSHYYVAAIAMRDGFNPYATDLRPLGRLIGLDGIARATDTPFFLLCFEPLTWLRPVAAYWAWFGINAVSLIVAMLLSLRAAPPLNWRQVISLCAIILLYPPVSNHIYFAQTQIVVLLLVVVTMGAFQARSDRTAGIALAAAVLLKVFPWAIAGYFVILRRWRVCGWMIAGLAAGATATIAAFGVASNASFVAGTQLARSAEFLARPANVALGSFVSRLFWYAAGAVTMSPWLDWMRALTVGAVELALIGLTIFATLPRAGATLEDSREDSVEIGGRRKAVAKIPSKTEVAGGNRYHAVGSFEPGIDREAGGFALWVTAAIMLSPTAWIHYLVLLILPFMLIAAAGWHGSASPRALWLMAASYATISLSMALAGGGQSWLAEHQHVKTALEECATLSLLLAYASVWFFVIDSPRGSGAQSQQLIESLGNPIKEASAIVMARARTSGAPVDSIGNQMKPAPTIVSRG